MHQVSEITQLRALRKQWQTQGKVVAFVPTMGNLHQGHLNLVREAKRHADIVVVSIFVNPMQFGANEDLDAYPRTMQRDCELLAELGVAAVFLPQVSDIYSRGLEQQTFVEVPGLSQIICGASRPGHFRGVATIVCKLFNLVQPNIALFGEKDFQQLQVIKTMVADLSMDLQVIGVPTTREDDGLAMSSRNQYLNAEQRAIAPLVYQQLQLIAERLQQGEQDYAGLIRQSTETLAAQGFKPDYIDIRAVDTLQPAQPGDQHLVILIAAFLGKTRLIDNLQVQR